MNGVSMIQAAAAEGTRDLLRLTCERCGPDWDEPHPDAALLQLCARLRAHAEEWQRLYDATSVELAPGAPTYDAFDAYSDNVWPGFALQDEDNPEPDRDPVRQLAFLPAHTAEGRRGRAAAVYAIEMAERYTDNQREDLIPMMVLVIREAAGDAALKIGEQI